jgi:20S proteasome alpha/beta subunit
MNNSVLKPSRIPKPRPKFKRLPQRKAMTVCIAAVCDNGRKVVATTDGLLSYGSVTADTLISKFYWLNDWCCMYAGEPSNVSLILGRLETDGKPLTRANVEQVIFKSYQKRKAKTVLYPYDMDLDEFKKEGYQMFGESEFARLSRAIAEPSYDFQDQILVVGWGDSEASAMLYEVSPTGDRDHAMAGVAAIGSGAEIALSTLLLLGQSRHCSLQETLYAVAAAKFSAEKSHGQGVGERTGMYVTWKRTEKDRKDHPVGITVQDEEIEKLRKVWEEHGRPKIPDEAWLPLQDISKTLGFEMTATARLMAYTERRCKEAAAKSLPSADK